MLCRPLAISAIYVAAIAAAIPSHAQDAVTAYYSALAGVFKPDHLIPTVIPRDEQPGNVYELSSLRLLADGNTCFPGLNIPNPVYTVLHGLTVHHGLDAGLAAGIKDLVSADASIGAADEIVIEFTDATSVEVAALTLVAKYQPKDCPFLQSEVEATRTLAPMTEGTSLLVVGEVIYAKRNIRLTYRNHAAAQAELSTWTKLISHFSVKASVNADTSSDSSVVVTTEEALPVAIRPAFVPDQLAGTMLGPGDGQANPKWYPLDLRTPASAWESHLVDDMATALAKKLPRADQLDKF